MFGLDVHNDLDFLTGFFGVFLKIPSASLHMMQHVYYILFTFSNRKLVLCSSKPVMCPECGCSKMKLCSYHIFNTDRGSSARLSNL